MSSVLSGLQRGVASALPCCDYHDPANFEVERRILSSSARCRSEPAAMKPGPVLSPKVILPGRRPFGEMPRNQPSGSGT